MNQKKFTAFAVALTMVFGATITPVQALGSSTQDEPPSTAETMPDLTGLEMPVPPVKIGTDSHKTTSNVLPLLPSVGNLNIPINGIPNQFDVPEGAVPLPLVAKNGRRPSSLPASPNVGDSILIATNRDLDITAKVAAVGANCVVYVEEDLTKTPKTTEFLPTGTTPHPNATKIVTEFDDVIYELIQEKFGEPMYVAGSAQKINIVLMDISRDGEQAGSYIAGYFSPSDFYAHLGGNNDTNIYVDIGTVHGFSSFSSTLPDRTAQFYGTIVHELQHLVNYSQFLNNTASLTHAVNDRDGSSVALWLNEGLSGLSDVLYAKTKGFSMRASHLDPFLAKNFLDDSRSDYNPGYVPYTVQWRNAPTANVFANYGASSVLMQEYYAVTGNVKSLVNNPKIGYTYSKDNVGEGYGAGDFNDFFAIANLNIEVDSPVHNPSNTEIQRYFTDVVDNMWSYREKPGMPSVYKPLAPTETSKNATFTSKGKEYYSETFLAQTVGSTKAGAKVTIPTNSKAEYYIITPYGATGVDTREKWNGAQKMAAKLDNGDNTVTVGTNNMFAILAVALDTPVDEEFSYMSADTAPPTVTSVTPNGTGVPLNGSIAITFSEPMDTAVAGAVKLNDATLTTTGGSWNSSNTIYTIPYSALTYNTNYTITIEGFEDVVGNVMETDDDNTFKTIADTALPTVTSVTPSGTSAPLNGTIAITFSKPMDPNVVGTVKLNDAALTATGTWSDSNTVYKISYSSLAYNTAYTISIAGFEDVAQMAMVLDNNHTFTTVAEASSTTFTITFDGNDGTPATQTKQTDGAGKLLSLPSAYRNNHSFEGWFTTQSGGSKIQENHVFSGSTTVYAQWTYLKNNKNNRNNDGRNDRDTEYDNRYSLPYDTVENRIDLDALNEQIKLAQNLNRTGYTLTNQILWNAVKTALKDAETTKAKANATQAQVDKATEELRLALRTLYANSDLQLKLKLILAKIDKLKPHDYSHQTWKVLQKAVDVARVFLIHA